MVGRQIDEPLIFFSTGDSADREFLPDLQIPEPLIYPSSINLSFVPDTGHISWNPGTVNFYWRRVGSRFLP